MSVCEEMGTGYLTRTEGLTLGKEYTAERSQEYGAGAAHAKEAR
jgi:hypothetical protein